MSIEAMKQALEALDNLSRYADTCELFLKETHPGKAYALRERVTKSIEAIASLRQAIEQAEKQEPVLWKWKDSEMVTPFDKTNVEGWTPLYTTPPQRKPLTDEERINISYKANGNECVAVELTEAKLKERNT